MGGVYFVYMGRRNPLTDWAHFFLGERYPWRNQSCQIWWRSLKGFRGSCGSNFSISHWLCWSSLQHSHTTCAACDYNYYRCFAQHYFCITYFIQISAIAVQYKFEIAGYIDINVHLSSHGEITIAFTLVQLLWSCVNVGWRRIQCCRLVNDFVRIR